MIKVVIPSGYASAKKYVFDFILISVLDIQYELIEEVRKNYLIQFDNNSSIEIKDYFFLNWDGQISSELLPTSVCYSKEVTSKSGQIPIFFGEPVVSFEDQKCILGFDLIGSIFFFLSRIEEHINQERDKHGRVLAKNSTLYKYNLLSRPIVDEYVYYLRKIICKYSGLSYEEKIGHVNVTCDVDWPFNPNLKSFKYLSRTCGVEFLRNKNIKKTISLLSNYVKSKIGFNVLDNNRESIDWIMDVNEKKGNTVTFYFIPKSTSILDNPEPLDTKNTISLLEKIVQRGHSLGVHPGYDCVKDEKLFRQSVDLFKKVQLRLFPQVTLLKSRMHFLRWDSKQTSSLLDELNISDDSTMGYAECAGFRCGTAYPHYMFDIYNFRTLNVMQTPLIIMESTIISSRYEGLMYTDEAFKRIDNLKTEALKYGGTFTLLWHNCHLINEQDKELYLRCI